MSRKQTATVITEALHAWHHAPIHIRAMASGFVTPLISALSAVNAELAEQDAKLLDIEVALADLRANKGELHGNQN